MFEILRRLFWGAYFHKYVSAFLKKKTIFPVGRIVTPFAHIARRQFEISFVGMPQIAHFQVEKMKKLPTVGGGGGDTALPHPPPARSLRSLGLGRFAPSQRLCPPKCFGSLRH